LIACACDALAGADSPGDLNVSAASNAIVEQPRAFGYVIGDVLAQRVLLELGGRPFDAGSLPRAERVSAWLERRAPRIDVTPDGRRWLVADYQIVNAPKALTVVRIPAWSLTGKDAHLQLTIAPWPISVAPLTSPSSAAQGGLDDLRPDRPAARIAERPLVHRIVVLAGALSAVAIAWVAWCIWRNARDAAAQPFARALREIRSAGEDTPEAWRALHRAFDRAAGRVTQHATLSALFERVPYIAPLQAKIEQFFDQSSRRFFAEAPPAGLMSVRTLCAELRRLEKANAR
jgi:mxaA protein